MIYIISDVHLSDDRPALCDLFYAMLEKALAEKVKQLIFIGDIFEYCLGADLLPAYWARLRQHTQKLHDNGIKMFFMPGNRDFLFAPASAEQLHWQIIPDPYSFTWQNQKILLAHGDSLLGFDPNYLRYRSLVRNPWVQRFFLALPVVIRQKIAQWLRKSSKRQFLQNPRVYAQKADIQPELAKALIQQHEAHILIHGHVHYRAHHRYSELKAEHWIIPDWKEHEGWILKLTDLQTTPLLERFSLA